MRADVRSPVRSRILLLGPALVAGVAYLDPGNVAANFSAGASFGYLLVWLLVSANLIAWLVQYLSAKLGVVAGQSLTELLAPRFRSRPARLAYWAQAEAVAMATDIAEVIGGAVALWLLFDVPLVAGGAVTGAVSMVLLAVQSKRGPRAFEAAIIGLLVIIAFGFTWGLVVAPPDPAGVAAGLVPRFEGTDSVLLAVSIVGATVMPHAIYAHSSLARDRFAQTASARVPALLRATRLDVSIAMLIAGGINLAMLLLAAANLAGVDGTDTLEGAHAALGQALGPVVATLFAVGLLASGLASTSVGAYAGAEIMHTLVRVRMPALVRRLVTLIPTLVILAVGVDPTDALIVSQIVLSFGIPFALVPLVRLTASRSLMGEHVNRRVTTVIAGTAVLALTSLNAVLVWLVIIGA